MRAHMREKLKGVDVENFDLYKLANNLLPCKCLRCRAKDPEDPLKTSGQSSATPPAAHNNGAGAEISASNAATESDLALPIAISSPPKPPP